MPKLIITETQYKKIVQYQIKENTQQLDPNSKAIVDDILNSINESSEGIMTKVKNYMKKGLMTATILSALMAAPQLTNAQKQDINSLMKSQPASTEMSQQKTVDSNSVMTTAEMGEWNQYVAWLKEKGLSGDKRMNHIPFSKQAMANYKQENPNANIDYNDVVKVQKSIRRYRDWSMNIFKNHPNLGQPTADVKADMSNYMRWVTQTGDDGIAGEYTSRFMFPKKYMYDKTNNTVTNQGFADPMAKR